MKKVHHVSASIEGLLTLSNYRLGQLVEMDGRKARKELLERQIRGEKLIPSSDCEGFDPVKGCPGHEINKYDYNLNRI